MEVGAMNGPYTCSEGSVSVPQIEDVCGLTNSGSPSEETFSKLRIEASREIWNTLSAINVNDHTETKSIGSFKLTYLSWAWAWAEMIKHYPQFDFFFHQNEVSSDGSVTVVVSASILHDNGCTISRMMWLPVMDNRNKSIQNPSSREISDAKMRCLVKVMALFGLGHYIYAGEDIPRDEPATPSKTSKSKASTKPSKSDMEALEAGALTMEVFLEDAKDIGELRDFWSKNKSLLKKLEENNKSRYDEVLEKFMSKSSDLSG